MSKKVRAIVEAPIIVTVNHFISLSSVVDYRYLIDSSEPLVRRLIELKEAVRVVARKINSFTIRLVVDAIFSFYFMNAADAD